MAQKINPQGFRIGINKNWTSRWFDWNNYAPNLEGDYLIRKLILQKVKESKIESIEIERSTHALRIAIHCARPGLIIGRGGAGIDSLRKEIDAIVKKSYSLYAHRNSSKKKNLLADLKKIQYPKVNLSIEEVPQVETSAAIVSQNIAEELERRIPFRRVIKQALAKVTQHKEVLGAKITVSGRLNGAEIARDETVKEGRLPLNTLRANIDFAMARAHCTYGTIGIKVWIYKGDIFDNKKQPKA